MLIRRDNFLICRNNWSLTCSFYEYIFCHNKFPIQILALQVTGGAGGCVVRRILLNKPLKNKSRTLGRFRRGLQIPMTDGLMDLRTHGLTQYCCNIQADMLYDVQKNSLNILLKNLPSYFEKFLKPIGKGLDQIYDIISSPGLQFLTNWQFNYFAT